MPEMLDQMVIELKSTAEEPEPIDDIPGASMKALLEDPEKAFEDESVSICQGLEICSGSHRELAAALEQAKKSKGGAPQNLKMYKDLAPRVQEIYKSLVKKIERMQREHAKLIRELANSGVGHGSGSTWQEEQEQRPY